MSLIYEYRAKRKTALYLDWRLVWAPRPGNNEANNLALEIGMIKILVLYHSQTGNTERMARALARGVEAVEGVEPVLKRAGQAGLDDLLQCQGLAIGTPENFGYMSGMLKDFFDRTYPQAQGRKEIFRKPYLVFISAGNDGRGALTSIERICLGYQFKKVQEPLIARGEITEPVLERCHELGQTIAAGVEAGIY